MIYIQLFITFFVIGIFTIGGGYAMLSLIQGQVVMAHHWIDEQTFTDIVGISQMTPGPIGINSATYVGYSVIKATGASEIFCVLGSFTTTLAVVLPSFIIVLALCHVYTKFSHNHIFEGVMSGLRPAVFGLVGSAAVILITPDNFIDFKSWILFAAAFLIAMFTRLSPIWLILASALAGFLLYG